MGTTTHAFFLTGFCVRQRKEQSKPEIPAVVFWGQAFLIAFPKRVTRVQPLRAGRSSEQCPFSALFEERNNLLPPPRFSSTPGSPAAQALCQIPKVIPARAGAEDEICPSAPLVGHGKNWAPSLSGPRLWFEFLTFKLFTLDYQYKIK